MSCNAALQSAKALAIIFTATMLTPCKCKSHRALINMIRHGEKNYTDKSVPDLSIDGYNRAEYIAHCASIDQPSLAFPRGRPTALLASLRPESQRPKETLMPLSRSLGLPVREEIQMADVKGFADYVQNNLRHGDTWLAAWQHWFIPLIAKEMDPNGLSSVHFPFPDRCNYTEWGEPDYIKGRCYDLVSQWVMFRENTSVPWRIQAYTEMHMGFGGSPNSTCASSFRPHSSPASWEMETATDATEHTFQPYQRESSFAGFGVFLLAFVVACLFSKAAHLKGLSGSFHEHLLASTTDHQNNGHTLQRMSICKTRLLTIIAIETLVIALLVMASHFDVHDFSWLARKVSWQI